MYGSHRGPSGRCDVTDLSQTPEHDCLGDKRLSRAEVRLCFNSTGVDLVLSLLCCSHDVVNVNRVGDLVLCPLLALLGTFPTSGGLSGSVGTVRCHTSSFVSGSCHCPCSSAARLQVPRCQPSPPSGMCGWQITIDSVTFWRQSDQNQTRLRRITDKSRQALVLDLLDYAFQYSAT